MICFVGLSTLGLLRACLCTCVDEGYFLFFCCVPSANEMLSRVLSISLVSLFCLSREAQDSVRGRTGLKQEQGYRAYVTLYRRYLTIYSSLFLFPLGADYCIVCCARVCRMLCVWFG